MSLLFKKKKKRGWEGLGKEESRNGDFSPVYYIRQIQTLISLNKCLTISNSGVSSVRNCMASPGYLLHYFIFCKLNLG